MKKLIFIFLLLFIFISDTKALSKFYLGEKIPDMYVETISEKNIHNGIPFILRRDDGEFVYCLNQQDKINTYNYYNEYNYNNEIFNLTEEQLNKINLIAYYGYQYLNHTDLKWYGVTQFLIWKNLNYKDIYFTDIDGNKINAYEEEIKEIEELVQKHYELPSFSNKSFDYSIDSQYEIIDTNEVIDNYEIKFSDIDAYIKNNKVYISTKEEGIYEIVFVRKIPIQRNYMLYSLEGSQSLLYPGQVNDVEFKIIINVSSGSITINKIDSENIKREFATLEGAFYRISDANGFTTTVKTDENGVAILNKIPWGKSYSIMEIEPSKGYNLDNRSYFISLNKNKKDYVINLREKVIKGNLIINKYYGEEGNYSLEDGAVFEIYDINDNLIGTYETKNGTIDITLDYGEYYIIQKNGMDAYELSEKKYISILEEKDYVIDLFTDKKEEDIFVEEVPNDKENSFVEELPDKKEEIFKEEDLNNNKEQEDFIIVEVPDTKKYDYNNFVSIVFIVIGVILIIKSIKKTTH
ncbi:MAG: Cys-Gln thioester bond-forming surface protein [Bacilli bacterium]|nr:Cys-Gln thioester bond-forming surface protein [Bacilli bacterium]